MTGLCLVSSVKNFPDPTTNVVITHSTYGVDAIKSFKLKNIGSVFRIHRTA